MVHHRKRFENAYREIDPGKPSTKDSASKEFEDRWDALLDMIVLVDGKMIAYGVTSDMDKLSVSVGQAVAWLLLRCIPGKPEAGKWTKDGPALDWFRKCSRLTCTLKPPCHPTTTKKILGLPGISSTGSMVSTGHQRVQRAINGFNEFNGLPPPTSSTDPT